ncbi:glycosyltransferase [Bradyrhizobium vignae]|uniref:Glycosyltransferase n=1 Tax=Bradyrhizobium vignae TaxID=1549949 RepID=A0ABS3ZX91_9BRAD|nr:glycosyltransferase [Bradyrhizobium vignae]
MSYIARLSALRLLYTFVPSTKKAYFIAASWNDCCDAEFTDGASDAGGQIVVTGKGEPRFEEALLQAQERAPQSIAVKIGFDDAEARKIFAGSDFTLMPSSFEPCGLSQMYAQRFGSLPIGHRTGGLAETIVDGETGFLFDQASAPGFLGSLCRAFSTFGMKDRLDRMRRAAMAQAFNWRQSAKSYADIYRSSI